MTTLFAFKDTQQFELAIDKRKPPSSSAHSGQIQADSASQSA
jgi:hypothetical protein